MNFTPYIAHTRISAKEEWRYFFSDALVANISILTHIIVTILFYFATGKTLFFGIFTLNMIVWYIIATQTLTNTEGNLINYLSNQIQSGEVVTQLTRPYHYMIGLFSTHIGYVFVQTVSALCFVIPLGFILTGGEGISILGVLAFTFAFCLAVAIDFFFSGAIGLIAFWTEDAKPYYWIYSKLLFVFGGLLFPLDLFPAWFANIAKLMPQAFLLYYPARLLVNFSWELFIITMIGQITYLIIAIVICYMVYKRAIRKVNLNGG